METINNWNPRFVIYANSFGNSPERQLELDSIKYPGGKMAGFINWISEKVKEFRKKHPEYYFDGTVANQVEFTKFLRKTVKC